MRSELIPLTRDELLALPATIDLPAAGRALGMDETRAYELAKDDQFPEGTDETGGGSVDAVLGFDAVAATSAGHAVADLVAGGVLTLGQVSGLPVSVSLLDAARALGIGRTSAYQLARTGDFPCPLIKIGALYRVPTAGLLRLWASPHPPTAAGPG